MQTKSGKTDIDKEYLARLTRTIYNEGLLNINGLNRSKNIYMNKDCRMNAVMKKKAMLEAVKSGKVASNNNQEFIDNAKQGNIAIAKAMDSKKKTI